MGRFKHIILLISLAFSLSNSVPVAYNEKSLSEIDVSEKDVAELIESINEKENKNLFESDIILDKNNQDVDGPQEGKEKRNAQRNRESLWMTKVVPYVIDLTISKDGVDAINLGIQEFHNHTCVRFVPRTNEKNWINFVRRSGCYSSVGKVYWKSGGQDVSIGNGCAYKGIVMHELLHALGFWHEQSRPDRDQYVKIMWENIQPGKEHNFNKYDHGTIDSLKATYDLGSIMHYGKYAFSLNGKPTIEAISNPNQNLGQRNGFSKTDIFEVNALYDCSGPSHGWSSWSDYGPCDSSCNKIRQRFCASSDHSNCPGANSNGVDTNTAKCSNSECSAPIDGHWGRWSSWSQCSASCGQGTHTRTRQCNDPPPMNGGNSCPGDSKETRVCKSKRCGLGPHDCEFEIDMCLWKTDPQNNYRWYREQRSTSSSGTGPNGDATKHLNGTGYYVYAEASSPVQANQKTKLTSPVFVATSGRCLQFAYNMYGSAIGTLDVYVVDAKTGTKIKIFTKSGNQGQRWYRTNATITSVNSYEIVFEVIRGSSYTSDIALDDIFFKDGKCGGQGPSSTTSPPWTTASPTTSRPWTSATTTYPPWTTSGPWTSSPKPQGLGDCDFEVDMCSWTSDPQNSYRWYRIKGSTSSSATGPNGDATKPLNGTGYYVYAEASSPVQANQRTNLTSQVFTATSGRCLQFAYNMYGSTIGRLDVYVVDFYTGTKKMIFSKSGNQGQQWYRARATITSSNDYKVVFEVIRGSSYTSDIALDDIFFKDGKCGGHGPLSTTSPPWTTASPTTSRPWTSATTTYPPWTTSGPFPTTQVFGDDCNFDQNMCGWMRGPGTNKFSWTRKSGSTPSYSTGPNGDHTSGYGSYVYVETSYPAKPRQTATLVSKVFPPAPAGRCMSFYYHMYGSTMGSLNVYIRSASTSVHYSAFKISGNQNNKWHQAVVNISNMICDYEIVFEGVRGSSYRSDIALDDITFTDGPCPKSG